MKEDKKVEKPDYRSAQRGRVSQEARNLSGTVREGRIPFQINRKTTVWIRPEDLEKTKRENPGWKEWNPALAEECFEANGNEI